MMTRKRKGKLKKKDVSVRWGGEEKCELVCARKTTE